MQKIKKKTKVQLITIPECHSLQSLQADAREIFIRILVKTIRK